MLLSTIESFTVAQHNVNFTIDYIYISYIFGIQISDIYLCTYEAIFFANAILCSNIMCCVCVEECVYYIYTMHNQRKTRGNVMPRKTPLTDNKCCTGLNFMEKACRHNKRIPSKDEFTVDDH